jgi:hypothetical protein
MAASPASFFRILNVRLHRAFTRLVIHRRSYSDIDASTKETELKPRDETLSHSDEMANAFDPKTASASERGPYAGLATDAGGL